MDQENSIVISSKAGRLGNPEEAGTKLIMFNLEGDRIVGVHEEVSTGKDTNWLLKWFSLKGISQLYASTISPLLHQALTSLGIIVKLKDEISVDDEFYNRFIFD
ncbi:MAG: hypothetical protein LBL04_16295 [Bacteroidales bacterium]|nr:hypothetical protein [Bacteroidales bacterium]